MRKRVFQVAFICWCQNGGSHECTYCMFALLLCVRVCVYDVKACVSVSGPGHMADAAQLPVREAADSGGGVHLLAHTL